MPANPMVPKAAAMHISCLDHEQIINYQSTSRSFLSRQISQCLSPFCSITMFSTNVISESETQAKAPLSQPPNPTFIYIPAYM